MLLNCASLVFFEEGFADGCADYRSFIETEMLRDRWVMEGKAYGKYNMRWLRGR